MRKKGCWKPLGQGYLIFVALQYEFQREPDVFIVINYKYHLDNFDNFQFILQTSQPLKPHAKEPVINHVSLCGIVEKELFVL